MLLESYTLQYSMDVLSDMTDNRRAVFSGPMWECVISQDQVLDVRIVRFYFSQNDFLVLIANWPWLLKSDLGLTKDEQLLEINRQAFERRQRRNIWDDGAYIPYKP